MPQGGGTVGPGRIGVGWGAIGLRAGGVTRPRMGQARRLWSRWGRWGWQRSVRGGGGKGSVEGLGCRVCTAPG